LVFIEFQDLLVHCQCCESNLAPLGSIFGSKNKNCFITTTTFRAVAEIQKSADLDSYSAAGEEKKSGRRRLKALKKTVLHHMFAFLKM
jgi:hypothetical protein